MNEIINIPMGLINTVNDRITAPTRVTAPGIEQKLVTSTPVE